MMRTKYLAPAMWLVVAGMANALAQTPTAPPAVVILDFKADVQLDGTLANVAPDASLAPALQAMVRKRVAQWRYGLPTWQGSPVPGVVRERIVAEAVPVASGGYALRIRQVVPATRRISPEEMTDDHRMRPPEYPQEARRRQVVGTLVYAMRVDAQGKAADVQLVFPETPDRWFRMLDDASRAAIAKWRMTPTQVDGVPVDCLFLMPVDFRLDGVPMPPPPDMKPYRRSHPDVCPGSPMLLDKVEGTLL